MKIIEDYLTKKFGNKVVKNKLGFDPELSVCEGACYYSRHDLENPNTIKLYERVPYKTGLVINSNEMDFFVTSDDELPFSREREYTVEKDGQKRMNFVVKWGDSKYADDNIFLEKHTIQLNENLKKNEYKIKVRYDVLKDGTITAKISDDSKEFGTLKVKKDFTVTPPEEKEIKKHFEEYR